MEDFEIGRTLHLSKLFLAFLLLTTALTAQTGFPTFVDIAEKVGVTLMNIHGGASKDYIVEANGNGAAFFDYDNDGDVDILIVNGSTLEHYKKGGDPIVALYRNDNGRFVDVTANAGLRKNGWGMGACVADYDNDGNPDVLHALSQQWRWHIHRCHGARRRARSAIEHWLRVRRLRS